MILMAGMIMLVLSLAESCAAGCQRLYKRDINEIFSYPYMVSRR